MAILLNLMEFSMKFFWISLSIFIWFLMAAGAYILLDEYQARKQRSEYVNRLMQICMDELNRLKQRED